MKNIDELKQFLDQFDSITEMAVPVATNVVELQYPGEGQYIDAESIRFDVDGIYVEVEIYEGCGSYSTHRVDLRPSYFFDEDYIQDVKRLIKEREERAREQEKKLEEEAVRKRRKQEYTQYLNLRMKYGDDTQKT